MKCGRTKGEVEKQEEEWKNKQGSGRTSKEVEEQGGKWKNNQESGRTGKEPNDNNNSEELIWRGIVTGPQPIRLWVTIWATSIVRKCKRQLII